MKILIDTNIYLDFYRSNKDTLQIFGELLKYSDSVILTDQIIDEFYRSRETVIKAIKLKFDVESKLEHFSSSFLQDIPEFKELLEIQRGFAAKRKEIDAKISGIIDNEILDSVAKYFNELVEKCRNTETIYFTTDEIIAKAQKRKLIGNPPTSNKYSIGDEINWELILSNIKDDIIIVGRDNTYNENITFLKNDFYRHTGHFVHSLTDKITTALQTLGLATSEALQKLEGAQLSEIPDLSPYWNPPETTPPKATN